MTDDGFGDGNCDGDADADDGNDDGDDGNDEKSHLPNFLNILFGDRAFLGMFFMRMMEAMMVMAVMLYNNGASVHCSDVHEMGLLQLMMMMVMVVMLMILILMMVMIMMMILMIIFPAGFLQQGTEHWWLPRLQPDQFNHINDKISIILRIRFSSY